MSIRRFCRLCQPLELLTPLPLRLLASNWTPAVWVVLKLMWDIGFSFNNLRKYTVFTILNQSHWVQCYWNVPVKKHPYTKKYYIIECTWLTWDWFGQFHVNPSCPSTLPASGALDTLAPSLAGFELDTCSSSGAKTDVGHRFLFQQLEKDWESTQFHHLESIPFGSTSLKCTRSETYMNWNLSRYL